MSERIDIKRAETATGPMNIRHIPTFLQKAAYITVLEIDSPTVDCFRSKDMQQLLATTFPMLRELALTVGDSRVASTAVTPRLHFVPARYPRLSKLHLDGIQITGTSLSSLLRHLELHNHPTGEGAQRLEWFTFLSLLNTAPSLTSVKLHRYLDHVQPSTRLTELYLPNLRELHLQELGDGTTAITAAMIPSAPALMRPEVHARVVFVDAGGSECEGRVGGFKIDLRGPQDSDSDADSDSNAGPPGFHAEIRYGIPTRTRPVSEEEERAMLEAATRILSCAHVMSVECVHPPWGMSEAKWAMLVSELQSLRKIAVVQREGDEEEEELRRKFEAEGLTLGARALIAVLQSFRDVDAAYRGRRERKVERKEMYRGYQISRGGLGGGRPSEKSSDSLFPKGLEAVVVRGPGTFRYVKVLQVVGGYHAGNTPRAYGCDDVPCTIAEW
ncbi:hypothetical protein C8Q74DRAFT_848882 [Fomes fomentarius]|nr:hypothetical protein C8Q74DRAFT_848882 [Fomes fomentarius]